MTPLSAYVLTRNSEKHLAEILNKLRLVADEIWVIDSGSTDRTKVIAEQFENVKFIFHPFLNFKEQRLFAERSSSFDHILFLDCDEIPDETLLASVRRLKQQGFSCDAYAATRVWYVLGRKVHTMYPITSPDRPVRLYNRKVTSFKNSPIVHETPEGHQKEGWIDGHIRHLTFETEQELRDKLEMYTDLAAQDLLRKKKPVTVFRRFFSPLAAFVKWYFLKGGFRDGWLGLKLGRYAYDYTAIKYTKAEKLLRNKK